MNELKPTQLGIELAPHSELPTGWFPNIFPTIAMVDAMTGKELRIGELHVSKGDIIDENGELLDTYDWSYTPLRHEKPFLGRFGKLYGIRPNGEEIVVPTTIRLGGLMAVALS